MKQRPMRLIPLANGETDIPDGVTVLGVSYNPETRVTSLVVYDDETDEAFQDNLPKGCFPGRVVIGEETA